MMTFTRRQEFVSELLGTFLFLLVALGTVAFVTIFVTADAVPGQLVNGGYTNVTLGWGSVSSSAFFSPARSAARISTQLSLWSWP